MICERRQLVALGGALYGRSVTSGRTGNLSVRIDGGFLVTPTGVSLGRMEQADLSVLDEEGRHVDGPPPSKEWLLHRACYRRDAAVRAVAHVHSTHAVAVSLLADVDTAQALPPLTGYFVMRVGPLPLLPYHPPGDPGLAAALAGLPAGVRCALLANHGSVAAATDLESAVDAVEEIEETAKLYLLTRALPVRRLTAEQVAATRRLARQR